MVSLNCFRSVGCPQNPYTNRTIVNVSKRKGTDFPIVPDGCRPQGQGVCGCGRRLFLGSSPLLLTPPAMARSPVDPTAILNEVHPPRPRWYEELYAWVLEHYMKLYEKKVSGYKGKLFSSLEGENKKVLELGIGTGPNIQYYANGRGVVVYGVDPNKQMEKYAKAAALRAGLSPSHFYFFQAVGEALPVEDSSMDVVVGTLVLCSVKHVHAALEEVKRVLKPGGRYIFLEHVAAPDETLLRLLQGILNPIQNFVADGCHLNRETGKEISKAGFSDVDLNMAFVPGLSVISPHVYGVAFK